ncbi:hypothetical protein Rrhod_4328 [Rhodococcus rhodnii LMG 5362]|uniref:Uncharacterized protein n=1 Tax=Rhodococcus rhodnii LMG 5362 TaxID=1273125 RepID=R7WGV3_9NOCA|nr:hypothetical protein Rrhod_4328 [Rhodococcus rhodnii LMG 5362]
MSLRHPPTSTLCICSSSGYPLAGRDHIELDDLDGLTEWVPGAGHTSFDQTALSAQSIASIIVVSGHVC